MPLISKLYIWHRSLHETIRNNLLNNNVVSCLKKAYKQKSILIWLQLASMSISSLDDRKRNAAFETMSLRMLINLAFRCVVMCVLKKCCHLSESLSVVRVRGFTTICGRHFSSVNCVKKLWAWLATAELSLRRERKSTMSTNKTKKVKMATKSCPECDQQVRQYVCSNSNANAFNF